MDEITVPIEDELVEQLRHIILTAEPLGAAPPGMMVLIIDRTKGLKIGRASCRERVFVGV